MKRKTIAALVAITAVIAVAMLAGCIEEMATTPSHTPVSKDEHYKRGGEIDGNTG